MTSSIGERVQLARAAQGWQVVRYRFARDLVSGEREYGNVFQVMDTKLMLSEQLPQDALSCPFGLNTRFRYNRNYRLISGYSWYSFPCKMIGWQQKLNTIILFLNEQNYF